MHIRVMSLWVFGNKLTKTHHHRGHHYANMNLFNTTIGIHVVKEKVRVQCLPVGLGGLQVDTRGSNPVP